MGYMGLNTIMDSDDASGLSHGVLNAAAKELSIGLKSAGNRYNTAGCVNVALIFEQCFCKTDDPCIVLNDKLREVATRAVEKLEKRLAESKKAEWPDKDSKREHVNAYRRMIRNLRAFLARGDL